MNLISLFAFWLSGFTLGYSWKYDRDKFPKDFYFGVASSSYQVEGGWNEGGKTMSMWDYNFHVKKMNEQDPCWVADCSNGDISTDSFHNYKRDVQMLKELGVDHYRFSISWPRILPTGFPNKINQEGIAYYNNLIDELLANDIEPMVTLYHWDLPQSLQDLGGWTNSLIADWFEEFVRIAFREFGDRVKLWITINEPMMICQMGYGDKYMAPAIVSNGIGNYMCYKNVLLAHARAFYVYDNEFRKDQAGSIGITISLMWYEPLTNSKDDAEAVKDMRAFEDWPADPIFSPNGNYSKRMIEKIAKKSKQQGFAYSRLPALNDEEVDLLKGSSDFFGLNYYSTYALFRNGTFDKNEYGYNALLGKYGVPSFVDDVNVTMTPNNYKQSFSFTSYAPGLYKILKYIQKSYNNPRIFITENGFPTQPGLNDEERVTYITEHLRVLKKAINDGVKVDGYTHWSLMDSFEWTSGYQPKFGLYDVDFNDPKRTRTPKKSAKVYADIIKNRKVSK